MVCEFVDQVDEVGHAGRESEVVEANEANIHNVRLALETATIAEMRKISSKNHNIFEAM